MMKSIFDKVSNDSSKIVIKRYSTSFYFSSSLLSKSIRQDIFNVYGFVRLADEIVDTFHEFPKKELLDDFEKELWRSIDNKISLNPILNSFQSTVNKYSIPKDLIISFLDNFMFFLSSFSALFFLFSDIFANILDAFLAFMPKLLIEFFNFVLSIKLI